MTGRRDDGYHLLDSLVVFADVGDNVTVSLSDTPRLTVGGPRADGVPTGPDNLCLKAAAFMGITADIHLEKHLPAEAGIGGGSSDAAAVLRALAGLTGAPLPRDAERLGADVPVCLAASAARMSGIGDRVAPLANWPGIAAVLVNPGVSVPTPAVFAALRSRENPPLPPLPSAPDAATLVAWLEDTRNDLEPPARALAPAIGTALAALSDTGCALARMSGSGATCFGLYPDANGARDAAARLSRDHPDWWVVATTLG